MFQKEVREGEKKTLTLFFCKNIQYDYNNKLFAGKKMHYHSLLGPPGMSNDTGVRTAA